MVISQTPVRISFLGGGTDYPAHFQKYAGETLVTTINKYCFITVHRLTQFLEHSIRVHYSCVESVHCIDEIKHPSARECLRFVGITKDVEVHYVSDLPARTGLGSSSAATVGLLLALHGFKGQIVSREQVAAEAVHVEQQMIKERVGCQDQYACSIGGLLHLEFRIDNSFRINHLTLSPSRVRDLQERLMLFYTSTQRTAHEVLGEQLMRTEGGEITRELNELATLVRPAIKILTETGDLREFGALLHEGWMIKRRLSSLVSNPWIDRLYDRARSAGAIGGKLLGAGSGGFLLLYAEPEDHDRVRQALPELRQAKFAFENQGTRIIFYRPEQPL